MVAGADPKKVRITGVAYSATDEMVKDLFSQFGKVASLVLKKNPDQSCEGSGVVGFSTEAEAAEAVERSSIPFRGSEICICDMWGRSVVKLSDSALQGGALKGDEKGFRPADASGVELCVEFQNGVCWRGSACKFSHNTPADAGEVNRERGRGFGGIGLPRGTCFAFQQGNCSRGSNCRYLHLGGGIGGGGSGGSSSGYRGGFRGRGRGFGGSGYGGGYSRGGFNSGYQGGYGRGYSGGGGGRGRSYGAGNSGGQRGVCFAFQKGMCNRGENCRFRHEARGGGEGGAVPRGVCFDFQKGVCNRGDSCRYRHESVRNNRNSQGYDQNRDSGSPITTPRNVNEVNAPPPYSGTTADGKMKGNVKKWFPDKGFGIIASDGRDIFVHRSEVHSESTWVSLKVGEPVEFNVITGPDGRKKAEGVTGPDGGFVKGNENAQMQKPCFNFQKYGNCKFGGRCIFAHVGGPPPQDNDVARPPPPPGYSPVPPPAGSPPTTIAPTVSTVFPQPSVYPVATSYPATASYPATYPAGYPTTASYPTVSASYSYPAAAYSYAMAQPVTYAAAAQTAAYAYPITYGTTATGATYMQPAYGTTAASYFQPTTQTYTTTIQQTAPQDTKSEETPTTNEQTSQPAIIADSQQITWM